MFTIEDLIEKIYEPKTKDLFKDVFTSYTQGQYRATVVMLWTVVVCDLVYKLQYLRDIYNDNTAINILDKISEKQKKNPKNPEWENYLVKDMNERTQLITDIEKDNLEYLQKQRNLCAHPIITNDNILFKPSKELTRSLIRIALDSVLLKTPLLSKEYIKTILEDFEKRKDDFAPWDDTFERYLKNRYLNHLNIDQILNLFKLLWRIVFSPHNQREQSNIDINFMLLEYIFNNYSAQCIDFMKKNIDYYTYDNSDEKAKEYFSHFIIANYKLYKTFSEQTKAIFESETRIFPQNIPFYFITQLDLKSYIHNLNSEFRSRKETLQPQTLWSCMHHLKQQARDHNILEVFYELCIDWYSNSCSYDEADCLFEVIIKPNYKNFNIAQFVSLFEKASNNNQTYDRKKAIQDHKLIVQQYINLNAPYEKIENTKFNDIYLDLGGAPF